MNHTPETPDDVSDRGLDSNPGSPGSHSSQASTPLDEQENPKRLPSLRSVSDPQNMNPNSTPLGTLSNARRPPPTAVPTSTSSVMGGGTLSNSDAMLKARSLAQSRMGRSPASANSPAAGGSPGRSSPVGAFPGGFPANVRLPPGAVRPGLQNSTSAPTVPKPQGLSARRGMKLSMNDMAPPPGPPSSLSAATAPGAAGATTSNGVGAAHPAHGGANGSVTHTSKLDEFRKYIDVEKGWLTFEGAATLTGEGVDFSGGRSFKLSLDDVVQLEELGKGNYGTVYKVRHAPAIRFGPGPSKVSRPVEAAAGGGGNFTGRVMAMKLIRLELDEARLATILKELVILHECVSPYVIDFYGAFFSDGAVHMCIEYMDGGSIDKLYANGVPEEVLRRIAHATVRGLKTLKDDHNIIHRDVKPTNILVNRRGQVKICDFGVSGNLVSSIAKTNIGCQSYMAPERISGGALAAGGNKDGSYGVQSDIWSLGLTIIECAMGSYPYPPEASSTIFSQLNVSVSYPPSPSFILFYYIFSLKYLLTEKETRPSSTATRPTCPPRATRRRRATSSGGASTRCPARARTTPRCCGIPG